MAACSQSHSRKISPELHVGDVIVVTSLVANQSQSGICTSKPIAALQNTYETGQVSLAQWNHVQGEVNDTHKLDRHYYGLFGFLACNKQSIEGNSSNTAPSLRIHRAVKWLKGNNHLYASFFTKFETLFFFMPNLTSSTLSSWKTTTYLCKTS